MPHKFNSRQNITYLAAFGCFAAVLLLGGSFISDFFVWDDARFIYAGKEVILGHASPFTPISSNFYPTMVLYVGGIYFLSGTNPVLYHLGSLCLFAGIAFMVFILARRFTGNLWIAGLSAFFFIFFAPEFQCYYQILQACHLIAILGGLVSVYLFDRYLNQRHAGFLAGSMVLLGIAMGAKLSAAPAVLGMGYLAWAQNRSWLKNWRALAVGASGVVGVIGFMLVKPEFNVIEDYVGTSLPRFGSNILRVLINPAYQLMPGNWVGQPWVLIWGTGLIWGGVAMLWLSQKHNLARLLAACLAIQYVILLPYVFLPYEMPVLSGHFSIYGNLALCVFKAAVVCYILGIGPNDRLRSLPRPRLAALVVILLATTLYFKSEFNPELRLQREQQQVDLTARLMLDLAQNKPLIQTADELVLLNFPQNKIFTILYNSTSIVRIYTDWRGVALLGQVKFQPGSEMLWTSSKQRLRTGPYQITITSYNGDFEGMPVKTAGEKTGRAVIAFYDSVRDEIFYRVEDRPRH